MSTKQDFISAFDLHHGLKLGPFVLQSFHVDEKTKIENKEYEFHVTLELHSVAQREIGEDGATDVMKGVLQILNSEEKVIHTKSNHPFKLQFHDSSKGPVRYKLRGTDIVLYFVGTAERITKTDHDKPRHMQHSAMKQKSVCSIDNEEVRAVKSEAEEKGSE